MRDTNCSMEGTEQRARKMEKIQKKPDHRHSNPTSIDEYLSNQSSDHLVVACSHSMAAKTVVNSFLEAKIHPCSDGACGCVFAKHFHFHFILPCFAKLNGSNQLRMYKY